jgi:DNA-binding MarR family transcriptional regulator
MNLDNQSTFSTKVQRLIYELVKNYELCDKVCMAQHGVTASQGYTILSLPKEDNLNMNELSEAMGLASSTMTRIVDGLVCKELVYRKSDDEDRRVVRVGLTDRGQEVRRTLDKALQDFFKPALDEIREDERPAILHALEQVTKSIAKAIEACCSG